MTGKVTPDKPAMRISEVAAMFAVKPYTVREWLKAGKLTGFKINGQWRISQDEVNKLAHHTYGD